MTEKVLEMKGITKIFPGVKALDNVNFSLKPGEVHSLLGENGAGKSTLIKVLGGIYTAEEGSIYIDGEQIEIDSVEDARSNGISIIHQELVLVPHMTVAENVFLGREPMKGLSVDFKLMEQETDKLLNDLELPFKSTDILSNLTIANQQMVEIVKAISFESKILVMDEPTSSISDKEVDSLFEIIRRLKSKGVGIIYVSHKMNELEIICDRVTVMRDGQYVDTLNMKETTRKELVALMVGRDLENHYTREYNESDEIVLKVENLNDEELLRNINFELKKGEILGFSGLVGAGRSELMESIFGVREIDSGNIYLEGEKLKINSPSDAIKHKIALVPENRKESALFLVKSVQYNMTINILDEFMSSFKVNKEVENSITDQYIKSLNVKTPGKSYEIGNLSGGNQQKVVIGRWLATQPKVLILDEPTRGIDVGAKAEIYAMMNRLTNLGVSIIMISSELPEIINLSDRTYVMSDGEITGELLRNEMTQDKIMQLATMNL